MITVLKSKINDLFIEDIDQECQGSITIPRKIMDEAHIYPYERVEVNSKSGKGRISTYAIPGEIVTLNGGAGNHFEVGETVHVNCFEIVEIKGDADYRTRLPIII